VDWNKALNDVKMLSSKGFFHAALDHINLLERASDDVSPEMQAALWDEEGKLHLFLADYHKSVNCFAKSIEYTTETDAWVKYNVHLAVAYRRLSEFDTAYRYLNKLIPFKDQIKTQTQGLLFLNLSAILGIYGFYDQVILNTNISLQAFSTQDQARYHVSVYNNLGLAHLERGDFAQAELYLTKALSMDTPANMDIVAELGRLKMMQGEIRESIRYAQTALTLVWSRIINYEKEEMARLCHLLAHLTLWFGERDMAIRLNEKAQLFFGQLGMWRQWQDIDSEMADWTEKPIQSPVAVEFRGLSFQQIRHFLNCLDAMNAQELIHNEMSNVLDTRVHYVTLLASAMHLSQEDVNDLVLASRLCDYGLTALENEVVLNPTRSPQAHAKYRQHPILGVQMAESLNLPKSVTRIIADHHELCDGSGYPHGKRANDIDRFAKMLTVVDAYTNDVVIGHQTHSQSIAKMKLQAGTAYDEQIVGAFTTMFELQ